MWMMSGIKLTYMIILTPNEGVSFQRKLNQMFEMERPLLLTKMTNVF